MGKAAPLIFMMFAIILTSITIIAIAAYYGTADWTWMAQQNASLVIILAVFGLAMFTLFGWLKGKR